MLDWLESYLARQTGREQWPSVKARVESHLSIPNGTIRDRRLARYTVLSYEVAGQTYLSSVRDIYGRGVQTPHKHRYVSVQYNPDRPNVYYFAPACKLAGRVVIFFTVFVGAMAILISLWLRKHTFLP
jgi:hypothetical protein